LRCPEALGGATYRVHGLPVERERDLHHIYAILPY
jgi:hypothetical protein